MSVNKLVRCGSRRSSILNDVMERVEASSREDLWRRGIFANNQEIGAKEVERNINRRAQ